MVRVLGQIETDDSITTERAKIMKESAAYILQKCESSNSSCALSKLCEELDIAFSEIISNAPKPHQKSFKEKLWSSFHSIRLKKIPEFWKKLYKSIDTPEKFESDPWLMQYCSSKLFETAVKNKYPLTDTPNSCTSVEFTVDEENDLRYVAGFVIRSSIKKAQRLSKSNENKSSIIACLGSLNIEEGNYGNYFSYTQAWLERVNRGGLQVVNDEVYMVFKSMEVVMKRDVLKNLTGPDNIEKCRAIELLALDEDVEFHWTLVTTQFSKMSLKRCLNSLRLNI